MVIILTRLRPQLRNKQPAPLGYSFSTSCVGASFPSHEKIQNLEIRGPKCTASPKRPHGCSKPPRERTKHWTALAIAQEQIGGY